MTNLVLRKKCQLKFSARDKDTHMLSVATVLLLLLQCVHPQTAHLDLDDNTVTLGRSHACALERVDELSVGGEIVCWGDNTHGQLDPPSGLYVQLSASEQTTCAISIEERVVCWGGEVGIVGPFRAAAASLAGEGGAPGSAAGESPLEDSPLTRGTYLQVSLGSRSACAVGSSDGRMVCWGDDTHGQVTGFPLDKAWVQVSCGGDTCCGLWQDSTGAFAAAASAATAGGEEVRGYPVACWGSDGGGATGAPTDTPFLQVSLGEDGHGCGITGEYTLVCWGSFVGGSGAGVKTWQGTFVQVAAAEGLTCAIRGDGTLLCLGEARKLWSGRPSRGRKDLPPLPNPPSKDTQFAEISAQ